MNQKKAKFLRKLLRKSGIDFRQRAYDWRVLIHSSGEQQAIRRQLNPESGRAIYKLLKRDYQHVHP